MSTPAGQHCWFDAHLDLAYLAVSGRAMEAQLDPYMAPHPPAAVTLPSLRKGNIGAVLGTVFTAANGSGPEGYPAGDVGAAHAAGVAQLGVYHRWSEAGLIELVQGFDAGVCPSPSLPRVGVLIENADPIRSPEELSWWRRRGVVAVGLSWAPASRYAGGNSTTGGLTALGRAMVSAIDGLGIAHDLSHLSQRATDELLAQTDRPVIASHSNCRALLPGFDEITAQRHLADESVVEIARRGGFVGLNLFSVFLTTRPGRSTVDEALDHVERVCALAGSRAHVGLGSDMDGGFGADRLPEGVNRPSDLVGLAEGLRVRGWTEEEVEGFRWRNAACAFGRVAAAAVG